MPAKGDNLDAEIAKQITEHISNVTFLFTEKGQVHPSNRTVSVHGVFNNTFADVANGMSGSQPTINYEDVLLVNYKVTEGAQIRVRDIDYEVVYREPSNRGRTLLGLRKMSA